MLALPFIEYKKYKRKSCYEEFQTFRDYLVTLHFIALIISTCDMLVRKAGAFPRYFRHVILTNKLFISNSFYSSLVTDKSEDSTEGLLVSRAEEYILLNIITLIRILSEKIQRKRLEM